MGRLVLYLLIAATIPLSAACNAQLSPAARQGVYTLPETRGAGNGQAYLGADFPLFGFHLGVDYGLIKLLDLEASFSSSINSPGFAAMGSIGVKADVLRTPTLRLGVRAGLGLGCGAYGKAVGECGDHFNWSAYGTVYLTSRLSPQTALFLAPGYAVANARGAPLTHWVSFEVGFEYSYGPFFALPSVGITAGVPENEGPVTFDTRILPYIGVTLGVRWGDWPGKQRRPSPRRPPPARL